jgi:rare lipoprotein A
MQPRYKLLLVLLSLLSGLQGLAAQNIEYGIATIYSDTYQGKRTTSGEYYDRNQFTCSHRSYQFGSLLRVTRTDNNKSVVVRVNDRGAYETGRAVDISAAAAYALDMLREGKVQVKVEQVGFSSESQQLPNTQPTSYSSFSQNNYSTANDDFQPRGIASNTPAEYSFSNTTINAPTTTYPSSYGAVPPAYDVRYKQNSNAAASNAPTSYNYSSYSNAAPSYSNGTPSPNDIPQSFEYSSSGAQLNNSGLTPKGVSNSTSSTPEMPAGTTGYTVQLGSFGNENNLHRQALSLGNIGIRDLYALKSWSGNGGMMFKLISGRFNTYQEAQNYATTIKHQFLVDGYVLRL